jgi:hypothetical protein
MDVGGHQREGVHRDLVPGGRLSQQRDEALVIRATPEHGPAVVPALDDVNARARDEYSASTCHALMSRAKQISISSGLAKTRLIPNRHRGFLVPGTSNPQQKKQRGLTPMSYPVALIGV